MKIADIRITPIAVEDMPLLNTKGVHGSHFLRSIIEVECEDGTIGLGETYGAVKTLDGLRKVAPTLIGMNPFHLNDLSARVSAALPIPVWIFKGKQPVCPCVIYWAEPCAIRLVLVPICFSNSKSRMTSRVEISLER